MDLVKLNEDIILAQKIVSGSFLNTSKDPFNDSSKIYRGTNELIDSPFYIEALKDKMRILSVIGSGDQIINSILFGSKDISGFDISRFPKYYLLLKIAAIKTLNMEEYLDFFTGTIGKTLLSEDIYDRVRVELDENGLEFWDSLFSYFDEYELNQSLLFASDIMNRGIMVHNNPYLRSDNYGKLKEKIGDITITFYEDNIFTFFEKNKDIGSFNLINLSNIIEYPDLKYMNNWHLILQDYRRLLESLPIEQEGIALSYFFYIDNPMLRSNFDSDDYYFRKNPSGQSGIMLYKKR